MLANWDGQIAEAAVRSSHSALRTPQIAKFQLNKFSYLAAMRGGGGWVSRLSRNCSLKRSHTHMGCAKGLIIINPIVLEITGNTSIYKATYSMYYLEV